MYYTKTIYFPSDYGEDDLRAVAFGAELAMEKKGWIAAGSSHLSATASAVNACEPAVMPEKGRQFDKLETPEMTKHLIK